MMRRPRRGGNVCGVPALSALLLMAVSRVVGQLLDPDRARQRHHGALQAVCRQQLRAAVGRLGVGVDHVGQLAPAVQDGEAVGATDKGETIAPGERVEQRSRPDVLMQIDGHAWKITNFIGFIKIAV